MHAMKTVLRVVLFSSTTSLGMGCSILPKDHAINTMINCLPVHPKSGDYVRNIGASANVHPDFGAGQWEGADIGIPFVEVNSSQAKLPAMFYYAEESDPGPYAIPLDAPIEGGSSGRGDRHVIALDREKCTLYELYYSYPNTTHSYWRAGSGVVANLSSYQLRPETWTSADAAGLLILPSLVRYEEVLAGAINHAIRFTVPRTQAAYVWPARHKASSLTETTYPPMGQRFRLKASFDISGFSPANRVILRAMKRYGIILADNGSPWFISGAPDDRWNDDDLQNLKRILGSSFEAVDTSYLKIENNSGKAKQICENCGNGVCNRAVGETLTTCFRDCCRKKDTSCVVNTVFRPGVCCSKRCSEVTKLCLSAI
jgi:hypothetical protein